MSIQAKELVKIYSGRTVVQGISFNLQKGEVVGLLGKNGAGKTTSFDMIVGLVRPDSGSVLFNNHPIDKLSIHQRARLGMSYLPQEPSAFRKLTVEENIRLPWDIKGMAMREQEERLSKLLSEFQIEHLRKSQAISLSGGERRRLEIARALSNQPDYLLLDEPFTGVDPIAIQELQGIIRELVDKYNLGILLTDHNPKATLSITDRAYIVQNGEVLVSGSASELAEDATARKFYLGENFRLD